MILFIKKKPAAYVQAFFEPVKINGYSIQR